MVRSFENGFAVFLLCSLSSLSSACQAPDVPVGGSYTPVQDRYLEGDKIRYGCYKSFLIGNEDRRCQPNGRWTGATPFCEFPTLLKTPIGSPMQGSASFPERSTDYNTSSCFKTKKGTGEYLRVYLDKPAVVNVVRLSFPKGPVNVGISLGRTGSPVLCTNINRLLEEKQWLLVICHSPVISDWVHVHDISPSSNILEICEVEIYVKDSIWCKEPPDVFIPNGWLQVSRDKATLQCKNGYISDKSRRLVCDNGKWSQAVMQCEEILCKLSRMNYTDGGEWIVLGKESKISIGTVKKLKCNEGYKIVGDGPDTVKCQASGTWSSATARCEKLSPSGSEMKFKGIIIAVSVVVIIIILTCALLVIFLVIKKKSKPVVVVVKQSDNPSMTYNESSEYSAVTYESIPSLTLSRYPTPPRSRPPVRIEPEYVNTADQSPPAYTESQNYTNPADSQQTENRLLETLKKSPVYG